MKKLVITNEVKDMSILAVEAMHDERQMYLNALRCLSHIPGLEYGELQHHRSHLINRFMVCAGFQKQIYLFMSDFTFASVLLENP